MKKLLLSFFIFFCIQLAPAKAQWVTIPDANFVAKLTQLYPSCMNGNQMDTTCSAIVNETNIAVQGLNIADLNGIQYFDMLSYLDCSNNQLTSLPALSNSLTNLYCFGNQLTNLPTLPNNLTHLDCNDNQLSSLPTLPNSLSYLKCQTNQLNYLPSLPAALYHLDCSSNQLTSLPALPGGLVYFNCVINQLTALPTLPNSITSMVCGANQLTSLPTLPNSITSLSCGPNQLSSLPVLPSSLITLSCTGNQLTSLPILPNSLMYLYCQENQLVYLPTLPYGIIQIQCNDNVLITLPSLPNNLYSIDCYNNNLISLPNLPNSLVGLFCSHNQLTSLPSLPNSLTDINCSYNQLTNLPTLPSSLIYLSCDYNNLTSIPFLPGNLDYLSCSSNQLTGLPSLLDLNYFICKNNQLTSIPAVPDTMIRFIVHSNNIVCFSNLPYVSNPDTLNVSIINNPISCIPNYQVYGLGLPVCLNNDPINNPNNCATDINISGTLFKDQNNNCILNISDAPIFNIPVKLYDSTNTLLEQTFSGNGLYGFSVNQTGNYTVKVVHNNIPFNLACAQADTQTVNLISITNGINNINFPLECDTLSDINVHAINHVGFVFPGQIHILNTNVITTENWYNVQCDPNIYSGTVNFEFTGPISYVSPTSGALIPVVNGNNYVYTIADFNSLTPSSFGLQFLTQTTAQAGDQICVHVEINPTPIDGDTTNNFYDFCYQVVNSYDPNMKEVYPVNVLPGYDDWFTYTIHFQNTGNAPAFNIRLRDTLDANLDINSFEVRGYSHPAQISLNGNILTVRFNNIMLPDSTSDYEGSMGYFQYRLKPSSPMAAGTQIKNTAYIYFDYNAPIITNTTINNAEFPVNASHLISDETRFVIYPNPSAGIFMFKDNKNIKTVEVFNMMGELLLRQGNANIINLQTYPKGIYVARINNSQICKLVKE